MAIQGTSIPHHHNQCLYHLTTLSTLTPNTDTMATTTTTITDTTKDTITDIKDTTVTPPMSQQQQGQQQ